MDEETGLYYYGARYYDAKTSVWQSVDPMIHGEYLYGKPFGGVFESMNLSVFCYSGNNPITYIDPDGNFKLPAALVKKYPRLAHYLKNNIQDLAKNKTIVAALKKYGQFTDKQIKEALKWGSGPEIKVTPLKGANGEFSPGKKSKELRIDSGIVNQLENAKGEDRDAALLLVVSTILHETTHYGDDQDGKDYPGEEGQKFEEKAYGRDIDNIDDAKKTLNEYNKKHGIKKRYSTKKKAAKTINLAPVTITAKKKKSGN